MLEHGDGLKKEMKHLAGDKAGILRASRTFVAGLSEDHGLEFDEFDLSAVNTYEEFEARATEFGWVDPQEDAG